MVTNSLIQLGDFTLNSGAKSGWKLECDNLPDEFWEGAAYLVNQIMTARGFGFKSVEGIPRGGLKLATALEKYAGISLPDAFTDHKYHLIVDDVLTTGRSMERAVVHAHSSEGFIFGFVAFSRGPCPAWITPLFPLPSELWLNPKV